ncbi:MAG: TatD family hydrolase [Proteobacteria bacterium]|nr:TatD family hydrolase [Pseudomonadota bacterium]
MDVPIWRNSKTRRRPSKKSEPSDVLRTLEAVSEIKGVAKEEVAKVTTMNAITFFDLAEAAEPPARDAMP